MTLVSPPDEAISLFTQACSRASYPVLRALYVVPATTQVIADAKGVTAQAISQQLPSLAAAGLLAQRPRTSPTEYELTKVGRDVFELVSGLIPPSQARLGWLVGCSAGDANPEEVRSSFVELAGEDRTFSCAGDIDYVAFYPDTGHGLALALAARLRMHGTNSVRAFVLPN